MSNCELTRHLYKNQTKTYVYPYKHTLILFQHFIRVRHYLHRALGVNVALMLLIAVLEKRINLCWELFQVL